MRILRDEEKGRQRADRAQAEALRKEAEEVYAKRRAGGGFDRKTQRFEWEQARDELQRRARRLESDSRTLMLTAQQQILRDAEVGGYVLFPPNPAKDTA